MLLSFLFYQSMDKQYLLPLYQHVTPGDVLHRVVNNARKSTINGGSNYYASIDRKFAQESRRRQPPPSPTRTEWNDNNNR